MGYGGYFMKGLSQGIQSGMSMGQQVIEMKWQKAQRKKLELKQEEIKTSMSTFGGIIKQLGADGTYSQDDELKIFTAFSAAIPEVQEVYKDAVDAIQTMNKNKLEEDFAYIDLIIEQMEGLDWTNAQGVFDFAKKRVKTESGMARFEAYENITKRKLEGIEAQPTPEVFMSAEEVREKYPKAGTKYTEQGYVPTFGEAKPKEPDLTGAVNYLKKFPNPTPEQFNSLKAGAEKYYNADLSNVTQESLREPEKAVEPKVPTPIPFKNLQDIKDSFKNVKTRAEYDQALASYEASKEAKTSDWTPPLFKDQLIDLIKKVEEAFWADFVTKDGKLKDKSESELYNKRVQQYLALIEEARNAGIDVSQFQAFISYKELYWGKGNPLVTKESW